jgi:predicted nucleic acid-binding protein
MLVDTQIVSFAIKDSLWLPRVDGASISSIVASELLMVQGSRPSQANYYIPHPSRVTDMLLQSGKSHEDGLGSLKKWAHAFRKHSTDSMIMEFGTDYPTLVEYGSQAIAEIINSRHRQLLYASTEFMPKDRRKLIRRRFDFLLDCNVRCEALRESDVVEAFRLLSEFSAGHNVKKNFRNSWNDMLILASAMNRGSDLVTMDNELARFVAEKQESVLRMVADRTIMIAFSHNSRDRTRSVSLESKGYINTQWRVRTNALRGPKGR